MFGRRTESEYQLRTELEALRRQLAEAEDLVRAIRRGEVDAFLVEGPDDCERVLTVEGRESAYRVLVEAMSEGAAILEEHGRLIYCNRRLATMLKRPLEWVTGRAVGDFVPVPEQSVSRTLLSRGWSRVCAGEFNLHCGDGSLLPVQASLSPAEIHGERRICAVFTDLTGRKHVEQELYSLSLTDDLTGLLNRRGFLALAEQQFRLARREGKELLLLFVDMDGMKAINDQRGHLEGDRALTDAADILRHAFRDSDLVGRLGGDEFVVLASVELQTDPALLESRLQRHVEAHNERGIRSYRISLSVGVIECELSAADSIGELLRRADAAMYEQKRRKLFAESD